MRCSSKLFWAQFCHPARASSVGALACTLSERTLLLFTLDTKTEKLHSGPSAMNDNPDRLIPNMSITLQFPGRLKAAASKKVRPASKWVCPAWSDPRIPFATLLTLYALLGCTVLGFNRSPLKILLTIVAGCTLEMLFHWLLCGRERIVPVSAYIRSVSIAPLP